jgi:uncharacterized membrane protein YgdD (TMEM256/DUF423 family)
LLSLPLAYFKNLILNEQQKKFILTGLILIITGIILGAFGAHGLKGKVSIEKLTAYETGVRYQLFNGVGMLALASASTLFRFSIKPSFWFILIGVLLFSGSIYGMTVQELMQTPVSKFFGPITPLGGLSMIIGWFLIFIQAMRQKSI